MNYVPEGVRPLMDFFEIYDAPPRVIVLGKGPSLSAYDPTNHENDVVIAINEAGESFRCDISFATDGRQRQLSIPDTVAMIRPALWAKRHGLKNAWVWDFCHHTGHSRAVGKYRYTACKVLAFAGEWGVHDLIMYGFDAFDGEVRDPKELYSKCLKRVLRERPSGDYSKINEAMKFLIGKYGHNCEWMHRHVEAAGA